VVTEHTLRYHKARFTPSVALCRELGGAVGMVDGEAHEAQLALAVAQIERLSEQLAAAAADLADYEKLRLSIATTLRDGAVVDKSGKIGPRGGKVKLEDLEAPSAAQVEAASEISERIDGELAEAPREEVAHGS
jgi:hypothetical protein